MGQISVEITVLPGSTLSGNQQPNFLDERIQLVATGLTGAVDWKALLNADTTIEGETLPVHRALAAAFASDLPALQEALGERVMPVPVNMVTLAEAAVSRRSRSDRQQAEEHVPTRGCAITNCSPGRQGIGCVSRRR